MHPKFILLSFLVFVLDLVTGNVISKTVYLPMSDGVVLRTMLHYNGSISETNKVSTLLMRTPYNADGPGRLEQVVQLIQSLQFAIVIQDFRGRFGSNGTFSFWRDAAADAYDTMEWIVKQPWSNQRIYSFGGSADGIAAYMQPIQSPSWLKGQCAIVATANVYRIAYQNGAYRSELVDGWLTGIKEPQVIPIVRNQESYNEWWYLNNLEHSGYKNINFPSLHLSSWWDVFQYGSIQAFETYRRQFPSTFLMLSPYGHCNPDRSQVKYPFHDKHGSMETCFLFFKALDKGELSGMFGTYKATTYYVMGPANATGSNGNYWVTTDGFPEAKKVEQQETSSTTKLEETKMEFVYNPNNPAPTIGGYNMGTIQTCGSCDQRTIESRSDVLTFTSAPFVNRIAVVGKLTATLFVSSNATDTDIAVRVTDVYPDGRSMLIGDGIQRMRWRDNPSVPSLMKPNTVYEISVDCWNTAYIFNPGNKLRISVTSSNFPRFSKNPNNGLPIVHGDSPIIIANNAVHVEGEFPSRINLPIVNIETLEQARI